MTNLDACTCGGARYDGDDGYDRDCPSHGFVASRFDAVEFYPDEYFVGFDGSKLAGDGYLAIARRDADGIITFEDRPQICDKGHCYCENPYQCGWAHRLGPWEQLTLDVWAAGTVVAKELDEVCAKWQDVIANGWPQSVVPFDVLGWLPYMLTYPRWSMSIGDWRIPENPLLPQIPRTHGLTTGVQWWAECFPQWKGRSGG